MALRQGEAVDAPYVVMDEFHYYADRDRGIGLADPAAHAAATRTFLLMSATLGNTASIEERIAARRRGARSPTCTRDDRPVPLDFELPRDAARTRRSRSCSTTSRRPIYVVNFTQRECAEHRAGA